MSEKNRKPEITFFAGPNGSSKSTITELIRPDYKYINVDEIMKNLDCTAEEAFRIFKKRKEKMHYQENLYWYLEDIKMLTGVVNLEKYDLNSPHD